MKRLLVGLALVAALLATRPSAVQANEPARGDDIHLGGVHAAGEGSAAAPVTGPGYTLFGNAALRPEGFVVRLIASPGVDNWRDELGTVAQQLATIGINVTIAAGTIDDRDPVDGEITFEVDDSEGCGGSGAGCGGPGYGSGPNPNKIYSTKGWVWIRSVAAGYTAGQRFNLVAHEMGHALNLGHFDSLYNGQIQVMHSESYAATDGYRSGDINGLAYGRDYGMPSGRRIGTTRTGGVCSVVEGEVGWQGRDIHTSGCVQSDVDGIRIATRDSAGTCMVKEGQLNAQYGVMHSPGCAFIDLEGNRIATRDTGGNCRVKEGGLSAQFVIVYASSCAQITLGATRIGVVDTNGSCWVKEGGLSAQWVIMRSSGCTQISVSANRVATRESNGRCQVKEGDLYAQWSTLHSPGCQEIVVEGDRVASRDANGDCLVKQGGLGAVYVLMYAGCADIAMAGDRIAVQAVNGSCHAKEGGLDAQWAVVRSSGCIGISASDA